MLPLHLHQVHTARNAHFCEVNGNEAVAHYGNWHAEHEALRTSAGIIDLSFRGRICLTGADRVRLLNGQVTNDIKALAVGRGCHAAFCGPKGRLVADAHIYQLPNEVLLDFEPGLTPTLVQRLEHHIVAEDVQVVDVGPYYGLLSVQGPKAEALIAQLNLFEALPTGAHSFVSLSDPTLGEIYLTRLDRVGFPGYDLFTPIESLETVFEKLAAAGRTLGGREVGFTAFETARFEAGIPRFGIEMDETHLPPETGLEKDAISYTKGCYTGQETIARLRTYGQVVKALRGLQLHPAGGELPKRGDKLVREGKVVGQVMSALRSPAFSTDLALGYVRKECNAVGTSLVVQTASGEVSATIVALPFAQPL